MLFSLSLSPKYCFWIKPLSTMPNFPCHLNCSTSFYLFFFPVVHEGMGLGLYLRWKAYCLDSNGKSSIVMTLPPMSNAHNQLKKRLWKGILLFYWSFLKTDFPHMLSLNYNRAVEKQRLTVQLRLCTKPVSSELGWGHGGAPKSWEEPCTANLHFIPPVGSPSFSPSSVWLWAF